MAGSPAPKEQEVRQLLNGPHTVFLNELETDIRKSTLIEKKWQRASIGNCHRWRDEMYEFQFEFVEGALQKIEQAAIFNAQENGESKTHDVYEAFAMMFDEIAVRCTHLNNQLQNLLKALAAQDPTLSRKYYGFLGAGVGTALVASALGSLVIAHALPTAICTVTLTAVAVPLLIGAAVALTAAAGYFLYRVIATRTEKNTAAFVNNWAANCFPTVGKLGLQDGCTDAEIETKFHDILCTMKSDEKVWKSNAKLLILKSSLEKNKARLTEEKERVEREDRALCGLPPKK